MSEKKEVMVLLHNNQKAIESLLPSHVTGAYFLRSVVCACQRNPALMRADKKSLLLASLNAASAGLMPDGVEGALIPRKDKERGPGTYVSFQPMYQGKMKLARQSGDVGMIFAAVVHAGDDFQYVLGLSPDLVHIPGDDPKYGEWTHAYAVAELANGSKQFVVLTRPEVFRMRDKGRGAQPAWKTDEEAMAEKTAIHALMKYLPKSSELSRAIALDGQFDRGETQPAPVDLSDLTLDVEPDEWSEPQPEAQPGPKVDPADDFPFSEGAE